MLSLITKAHNRFLDVKSFFQDENGATAIEYGLIAAGIAVAILTAVFTLGNSLENQFTNINNQISS
jgi:pilus assembly protein Flp/PilA